jgi:stress response protein YsnF
MTDRSDYMSTQEGSTYSGGSERTVTAMYDTRGAAETARDGLVSLGISSGDISIRGAEGGSTSASSTGTEDRGFWAELKDLFVPDEDRHTYAEGMRRGGCLLTARVPEGMVDEALEVLERSEPVDIDERSQSWRQSGWSGYSSDAGSTTSGYGSGTAGTTTTGYTDAGAGTGATGYVEETTTTTTATTGGTATGARTADLGVARTREDGVVERAEEQLRVGKREVGRGTVRVRSYVVETPVEEQVTLRDERVHVERRPVDRPVRPGDAVFEERVIEASERAEEAVVSKEARVVEEIGLRKEGDVRTETIRDTVRRQEVEVEDERTTRGTTAGVSATTTTTGAGYTGTGTSGTTTGRDYGTGPGRTAGERVSDALSDTAEATGLKSDDRDEQRRRGGV